jgi:hypothetical protein
MANKKLFPHVGK